MTSQKIDLEGTAGRLEAVLSTASTAAVEPTFDAVVAHPHPLYGGSMANGVVVACASALAARGARVLRFNFRGVGGSQGEHSGGPGELEDLEAAVAHVTDLAGRDLLLAGYSFGAWATLERHRRRAEPVAGALLVLAPPLTHYDFSFLADNHVPLGVVCGESDPLTPAARIDRDISHWGALASLEIVATAGHDLGTVTGALDGLSEALDRAIAALERALLDQERAAPVPSTREDCEEPPESNRS